MPKVTIDGRRAEVPAGRTVLEAAREAGIKIPTLCYHRDLSVDGSCRLCMVEVENMPGQAAACTLPVSEGMVVSTTTVSTWTSTIPVTSVRSVCVAST